MTDHDSDTTRRNGRGGFAGTARQRAIEAYESALDGVSGAGRRAATGLGEAPLIALAGGLAAGALIAALLPRTSERSAARPPDRAAGEEQRQRRL